MPAIVGNAHRTEIPVEQWAGRHGLILPLLDFGARETDVVARVAELREEMDALRDLTASFHLRDLVDDTEKATSLLSTWIEFLGAWPYVERSIGQRWVNPDYIHAADLDNPVRDDVDRVRILRRLAGWGHFTVEAVAPRFGIGARAMYNLLDKHGISWPDWRREGIRALARTLATNIHWGASRAEVTAMVPRPDGTVRSWIYQHATAADWEPPADPSAVPRAGGSP